MEAVIQTFIIVPSRETFSQLASKAKRVFTTVSNVEESIIVLMFSVDLTHCSTDTNNRHINNHLTRSEYNRVSGDFMVITLHFLASYTSRFRTRFKRIAPAN
jgi:hypothetical protein